MFPTNTVTGGPMPGPPGGPPGILRRGSAWAAYGGLGGIMLGGMPGGCIIAPKGGGAIPAGGG